MLPQFRMSGRKVRTHAHKIIQQPITTLRMRNQQIIFTPAYLNPPVAITAALVMAMAVL